MATKIKRSSYTAEFKVKCIEKAEELGNREAGRLFGVDEKNVRLWRKSKAMLLKTDKNRRSNRGGISSWPELQEILFHWLLNIRDSKKEVSVKEILAKARTVADELGIKNFGCKKEWCSRFLKRKKLKICDGIVMEENIHADFEEKTKIFLLDLQICAKKLDCDAADFIVMNELCINLDSLKNSDKWKSKFHFSVVLAFSVNGSQLKPLIIFRIEDDPFGEDFPDGLDVEASEGGRLDPFVMMEWFNLIWMTRKEKLPSKGVLLVDSKKAKILSKSAEIFGHIPAEVLVIPDEMMPNLQPLEVNVVKYFDLVLKNFLEKLTPSGSDSGRPNLTEIAEWVKEAWSWVSPRRIIQAFADSGMVKTIPHGDNVSFIKEEKIDANEGFYVEEIITSESDEFDPDNLM